jgi:hypothetical protein
MGVSIYLLILFLLGLVLLVTGMVKQNKKLKVTGAICILIPLLFIGLLISPLNKM